MERINAGRFFGLKCTLVALALGMLCNPAAATEIYTWVDEHGVVHFSDQKPLNSAFRTLEIEPHPPAPAAHADDQATEGLVANPAAQERRDAIARAREQSQLASQENTLACAQHRDRLEQMEPARRAYYTDADGQRQRMDDFMRVSLVEESRRFIEQNCQ